MERQSDLFSSGYPAVSDVGDRDAEAVECEELQPIAVPCGFLNRASRPCSRLAHERVRLDGRPFASRGRPMLHCSRACYNEPPEGAREILE